MMKRLRLLIFLYMMIGSLVIGALTGAYLQVVNLVIHFFWQSLPQWLAIPKKWQSLAICLPMGLVIGLLQKHLGQYPLTIGQVLGEVRTSGHFRWNRWWKILLCGLLILGAGADVGPEASASGLVAGMVYWLGCRYKQVMASQEKLAHASLQVQLSVLLLRRTESLKQLEPISHYFSGARSKKLSYAVWIVCGFVGMMMFFMFFPQEGVIGIHLPRIDWQWHGMIVILPSIICGWAFGWLFSKMGEIGEHYLGKPTLPLIKGLVGGFLLVVGSWLSTDVLFSGEFTIQPFAEKAYYLSPLFLVTLGLTKAMISNVGFALGWRGGTIFPAIFSSLAMAAALAQWLVVMPRLTVTIFVAVAITTIIRQPLLTIVLLSLLCPLQFLPLIIAAVYCTHWALHKWTILQP